MDFLSGLVWNIKIAAVLLFWYTSMYMQYILKQWIVFFARSDWLLNQ